MLTKANEFCQGSIENELPHRNNNCVDLFFVCTWSNIFLDYTCTLSDPREPEWHPGEYILRGAGRLVFSSRASENGRLNTLGIFVEYGVATATSESRGAC